ncbi:hypothetical protein C1646_778143 [Rhizophagus diaphanus]|nr:hypothetical protein C1646_778143 [Rhizophagus diaphanus] [Rhizophagus sp. MUCL 43196]
MLLSILSSSTILALWNFRSQFFSILALRFEGPSSVAFQLFSSKVPVCSILALQFEDPGSFFDNFSALTFSSAFQF